MIQPVKAAGRWLKTATDPQPDTTGNYDAAPYLPSGLEALVEGLALRGPEGAATSVACALLSVYVQDKTQSNLPKEAEQPELEAAQEPSLK